VEYEEKEDSWRLGRVTGDLCNFKQVCVETLMDKEKKEEDDDESDDESEEEDEDEDEGVQAGMEKWIKKIAKEQKKERSRKCTLTIKFVDAMNFTTPMPLSKFVKTFRNKNDNLEENKGLFPFEVLQANNFDEVLSLTIPFPKDAFHNSLKKEDISDDDYERYLKDWEEIKVKTRWDYLEYYNRKDVEIMIKPITYLINVWAKYQINMLSYMTLASCSQAVKYMFLYKDLDMDVEYYADDFTDPDFNMTYSWFQYN
jgi:hypothetical protein